MNKQEAIAEIELIFKMVEQIEPLAEGLSDRTFGLVMQPFYATAAQLAIENGISEKDMESMEAGIFPTLATKIKW